MDPDAISSDSSDSSSYDSDSEFAWIPWFTSLKGNEFYCEVDAAFIQDAFNLTGLHSYVTYYDQALDVILDAESPDAPYNDEKQEIIENDAEILFGLIHARYILTQQGLQQMLEKYRLCHFGRCPRVLCRGQPVLPCGSSDHPARDCVKLYCPSCEDLYHPRSPRIDHIDGAHFGTTFCHLFFLTYPEYKVSKSKELYVPRVFGFRLHKTAFERSLHDRMQFLNRPKSSGNSGNAANPNTAVVPLSNSHANQNTTMNDNPPAATATTTTATAANTSKSAAATSNGRTAGHDDAHAASTPSHTSHSKSSGQHHPHNHASLDPKSSSLRSTAPSNPRFEAFAQTATADSSLHTQPIPSSTSSSSSSRSQQQQQQQQRASPSSTSSSVYSNRRG